MKYRVLIALCYICAILLYLPHNFYPVLYIPYIQVMY